MKRFAAFAMTLGLILGGQSALQAGPLDWSFEWAVTPPVGVPADGGGSVSMTDAISGSNTGSSTVIATNLVTNSSINTEDGTPPETFSLPTSAYNLTMTLTDETSGDSDTFSFDGHFEGTLSQSSALIDNFFDSPISIVKAIGDNVYTVEIGPYTPPGSPDNGGQGSIGAKVTVERGQGEPNDVPEPSTLLLSGLGLSVMGLVYRRKKA